MRETFNDLLKNNTSTAHPVPSDKKSYGPLKYICVCVHWLKD